MQSAEWFVTFTPIGWEVRSRETGEESGTFGGGREEYARAKAHAEQLNTGWDPIEDDAGYLDKPPGAPYGLKP